MRTIDFILWNADDKISIYCPSFETRERVSKYTCKIDHKIDCTQYRQQQKPQLVLTCPSIYLINIWYVIFCFHLYIPRPAYLYLLLIALTSGFNERPSGGVNRFPRVQWQIIVVHTTLLTLIPGCTGVMLII